MLLYNFVLFVHYFISLVYYSTSLVYCSALLVYYSTSLVYCSALLVYKDRVRFWIRDGTSPPDPLLLGEGGKSLPLPL